MARKLHLHRSLEQTFQRILNISRHGDVSVRAILRILSGKGKYLLLIFLCLPFCQPLQIPGASTPFGLAIIFIALRIGFGKHIWLPKVLLRKKISAVTLQKIITKSLWILKKLARFTHPRMNFLCYYPLFRIINILLLIFWGVFLALPLPLPLTNLIAGWLILLLSVGLLEDDGLLISIVYALTGVSVFLIFLLIGDIHKYIQTFL